MSASGPVLSIKGLSVSYRSVGARLEALRDVSLEIQPGQAYGLVGESGSGKSTLALTIMGALPEEGTVQGGSITFLGENIQGWDRRRMKGILGEKLVLVPQDPQSSLNPSIRVGEQVAEMIRHHRRVSNREARERVMDLFERVRLSDPERVSRSYPHQISGGMKQRVHLSMAMSLEPDLMILDEPTTSLDVTTEVAVLDIFRDLIEAQQLSILYISHSLGVVSEICERVIVLYAGEIAEDASTVDLYHRPLHPYSRGLLDSVPRLGANKRDVKLLPIQGRIPDLDALPSGCIFRPRCPLAIEICEQFPPLYEPAPDRRARCHRWEEIQNGQVRATQPSPGEVERLAQEPGEDASLQLEDLEVHFPSENTFLEQVLGRGDAIRAVDGVSARIPSAQTLGLVGESGSGKTTIARAIVGLAARTGGEVRLGDRSLADELANRDREVLKRIQVVFQEPDEALNPYLTVGATLQRPLIRLMEISGEEAESRAVELLESVHLPSDFYDRLPRQLSGGEKQRVAIARAFASNPQLLLADEPVSSLDVSVQASVVNVIHELQQQTQNSSLFISHDLAIVGYLSDRVAVIYLGRLMEVGAAGEIFEPPYHPYTEALLSAIPLLDPQGEHAHIRLEGELPSLSDYPTGCPFHTRCPRFLGDICVEEEPPWRETDSGRRIYCHIPLDELRNSQKRAFQLTAGSRSSEPPR